MNAFDRYPYLKHSTAAPVYKTIVIPPTPEKTVKVTSCADCPNNYYQNGMSDDRGNRCKILYDDAEKYWNANINIEVRENKFHKRCPL